MANNIANILSWQLTNEIANNIINILTEIANDAFNIWANNIPNEIANNIANVLAVTITNEIVNNIIHFLTEIELTKEPSILLTSGAKAIKSLNRDFFLLWPEALHN